MRAFLLLLPFLLFGQAKFNQIRIITSMDGTAPGQIEFDTSRADNNAVIIKAPTTATAGYTLTLPIAAPATTGDCLTGTTGGVLSFGSCAVGGYWTLSGADIYRLTGNVGIGLSNPAHKLDVLGASAKIYAGGTATDTTVHIGNSDVALPGQGGFLTFHASAATPYLSINALSQGVAYRNIALAPSGGNVGIGSTAVTSGAKLDVSGTITIRGTGTDPGIYSALFMNDAVAPYTTYLAGYTLGFNTGGNNARSTRMYIDNAGLVGIGTTSPGAALHVFGNNGYFGMSAFFGLSGGSPGIAVANTGAIGYFQGATTATSGVASNIGLQVSGGNVGIGTASPNYKLDVSGTLNATGAATLGAGLAVTGNLSFTGTLNTAISTTELGYLDGVTSAIQTQFSARVLTSTQIFTTSPITGGGDLSTNRTFACATCFTTAGGTMTGNLVVNTNLSVGGDYFPISDLGADLGSASFRFGGIFHAGGDNYGSHRTRNGANLTIMSGGAVYADAGSSVDFSGTVTTGNSATYSGATSCGSGQAVKTITVSRGLVTAVTCGTP